MNGVPKTYEEYKKIIEEIKKKDSADRVSNLEPDLTNDEKLLDEYMKRKRAEMVGNRYTYDAYAPALMFNKSYRDILVNDLFNTVFKGMPCGGNLHIHTSSSLSTEKFINILAGEKNVYVYWDPNYQDTQSGFSHGKFYYLTKAPKNKYFYNYEALAANKNYPFAEVNKLITFIDDRIDKIEYIWDGFNDYFNRVGSVLKVRKIYQKYYEESFKYQAENNNDYIEIRAGVSALVENNDSEVFGGTELVHEINNNVPDSITELYNAYARARVKYSDLKVKAIISSSRRSSNNDTEDIQKVIKIIEQIPAWKTQLKDGNNDFILGFDLVSEEDINHKTDDYAAAIIETVNRVGNVNFYFHDGESNWADNDNVHSAIALGSKRIGHGLNVYNFPEIMRIVKDRQICLEICPISNQMLRYIKDLRIHPIAQYIQRGIPCVVCSDDPQIFETTGTYFDLWEVYHGAFIDLKDLKVLIKNSYKFSGMSEEEKKEKLTNWEVKWETFVKKCVEDLVAKQEIKK